MNKLIYTNELCYYCSSPALFMLKNGNSCCSKTFNQCPEIKKKNSLGLKKAHAEGKMRIDQLDSTRAWNKGKTMFSEPRIRTENEIGKIFCYGSNIKNQTLKNIIAKEKLKPYECSECKITDWRDKKITLELDHISGDNRDNTLENLRLLCPNCHTQTPTYGSKNKKNKEPIDTKTLIEALSKEKNIHKALQNIGETSCGSYRRMYKILIEEALENNFIQTDMIEKEITAIKSERKKLKVTSNCLVCDKEYRKRHQEQKYCSQECVRKQNEKIDWDSLDLETIYKEQKSLLGMARFLGVSDNGVRKQLKKRGIIINLQTKDG